MYTMLSTQAYRDRQPPRGSTLHQTINLKNDRPRTEDDKKKTRTRLWKRADEKRQYRAEEL